MNETSFENNKQVLIALVSVFKRNKYLSNIEENSIKKLLEILDEYSFENRLKKKGLLTRTIIDSLELDYSLGERFIEFDNRIR